MKRQANILSSVITNFETVEDVIETSMNSAGSAYAENEKWLDSIEGKTYQFTNALETMWGNLIDSNTIKSFIDFGTTAVKILDTIPGRITAILLAIKGIAKFKGFSLKGLGLETLTSLTNLSSVTASLTSLQNVMPVSATMSSASIQSYAAAVSSLTANQQAAALASAGLNKEQIRLALTLNGLSGDVAREATAHVLATNAKKQSTVADNELIKTKILYKAATLEAVGSEDALVVAQFLRTHATELANGATLESIAGFSALTSKQQAATIATYNQAAANVTAAGTFKALGTAMTLAFASNPVGFIISAITTLISVVSIGSMVFGDLFKSAKEAEDAAQDAINKYNETKESLKDQKKTIDELGKSYAKLSSGVNTSTNANIGLTTEAYEEYLNICNQIADIYPELIVGYDAQGNAILSLKGKVDQLNESYKESAKNAANDLLTPENKKDIWKTYEKKVADVKVSGYTDKHEYVEITNSDQKKILEAISTMSHQQISDFYNYDKNGNSAMWDVLRSHLKENNLYTNDAEMVNAFNSLKINTFDSLSDYQAIINSKLSEINQDIATGMSGIKETLSAKLVFDPTYNSDNFSEASKGIVDSIVNNLDPEMISDSGAKSIDEFYTWFSSNVIQKIASGNYQDTFNQISNLSNELVNAMYSGDSDKFKDAKYKFDELIKDWINIETGDIQIDSNADVVTQYLQRTAKDIQEQSKNYEIKLQFKEEYESSLSKTSKEQPNQDYKYKIQEAKNIVSSYTNEIAKLQALGFDPSQAVFGNIDTNNRYVLEWTEENLNKYRSILESWGEDLNDWIGSYSTVIGDLGTFEDFKIAFSPMLQTKDGAVLLDNDTIGKYIFGLIEKARAEDGVIDAEDLFRLDTEGLDIEGTYIHGLIAAIGDEAEAVSQAMHFTGTDGSIAAEWNMIAEAAKNAGISAEEYVKAVQNGDWESIGIDIPETPKVPTASDLLKDNDAQTYIENARKMSKESYALAEAQQVMVSSLAGEDGILRSDELTDMYDKWIAAGKKMPDGSDWTDDQIAGLQILDALINSFNTDINTLKSSLLDLGLIEKSVADISSFNIASESTQEKITEFEKNISSIKEAWQSLNDGSMSKSEFIELAMELPELMDGVNLADDNWMVKAKENLEELNNTKIDDFISMLTEAKAAMQVRGEDTSVVDSFIAYANQLKNQPLVSANPNTLSALNTSYERFNEIQLQTSEIVADNIEVTQEYKEALLELGISSEDLLKCFDKTNPLIVKNVDLLNNLVKSSKKNIAQNTKLAKTQAKLKYYELYKKMRQLTNGRKVENAATLQQVNALYKEMSALEKTIAKYSILEHKLLGATNAYDKLADAQAADEAMDYGSKAEELVNVLAEAFNTAELGTEAAQVAIAGLIPDDVIDKTKTLDEQMQQIYSYFTKGAVSQLFTIEFDDEGKINSVEMMKEDIEAFTKSLIGSVEDGAVFQGTWDEFTLNPAITSLEEFADACHLTEEVAFAFLTSLEKYDISWLGGDFSTLLDQLMGDDLEYQLYDKMQKIANLEAKIANGTITSDEQNTYSSLLGDMESLEESAMNNAIQWAEASKSLEETKEKLIDFNEQLANTKEGTVQYEQLKNQIDNTRKEADKLLQDMEALGEPTEFMFEVGLDEAKEQIKDFKKDLASLVKSGDNTAIEIQGVISNIDAIGFENLGLTKNQDGTWNGLANIEGYSSLDEASKAKVIDYINLINGEHVLDAAMGDGIPTIEQHLADILEILQKTYELQVTPDVDKTPVMSFIDWLSGLSISKTISFFANKAGDLWNTLTGYGIANGTVHANGTAHVNGTAYKSGSWGAQNTETALVGELGPELLVRGSRWTTIGENGAEFTQVRKGDIIFNHKQTEDLLSKGYVTGRGKLQGGHAFVSGTAYAGINTWDDSYDKLHNDYSNATFDDDDDEKDDAEEVVDFIEMKLEEIEAIITKTSNKIANFLDDTTSIVSKDELYDELIKAEKDKSEAYLKAAQKYATQAAAALSGVPAEYQEMARNGAIAIETFLGEDQVEIAEAIQEYRDWATKADEAENGHLEAIAAISAHRVEQLEDIATDFENIVSIAKSHSDLIQAEMDFIEESGGRLSEDYYEELKKHSQKQLEDMQAERAALQKILDDSVAAGDVIIGSDDWYSMLEAIYEVDKEIIDCKTSLEEFQNAINELYWDNFEKLIAEIDAVNSELSNLYDLVSDTEDVVDEIGNWTDKGITSIGLLAQQMENAQFKSKQYGEAIAKLKKDYANGLYSVDEYNERLADLTDSQYDAIKSYEDAKDAIVDLNKTRVDAVKDGMQKEIDAYSELIEKKKESLSEDKDAYDFQKQIQESDKNIRDIERKIAALEGNTSSSAMAQRKRLEAELLKAKEEQQDMYYNHSIEKQQEALDKELEGYTKNKEEQMDALDEYLKKEEQVIADSFDLVAENTKVITDTLIQISEEYGVSISDTIATPWINGANAIGTYEEQLNTSVSATTKNLETLKQSLEDVQNQADKTAASVVSATNSTIVTTNDGHQTSIKGYAKGSNGVEYDQWALINELGDELTLHAGPNGNLQYLTKGSSVITANLTERLMEWGSLDPSSVLEQASTHIGTPSIATTNNNTITIDNSVGTLLHVEHLDGSNPAEVSKLVDKAWEKKMQTLNNSIKKFTR